MQSFFKPHRILGATMVAVAALCAVSSLYALQTENNLPADIKKELKNNLFLSLCTGITGFTILFKDRAINLLRDYTGFNLAQYLDTVTGQNIHEHMEALDNTILRRR